MANDSMQRIMRSYSPSVSPTWHHALTIQEEEEARMVLTFEWVSACPLLVLFSTQRSAWLQAPHIYNKFIFFIIIFFFSGFYFLWRGLVFFIIFFILVRRESLLICTSWALLNGGKLILDVLRCIRLTSQMGSVCGLVCVFRRLIY